MSDNPLETYYPLTEAAGRFFPPEARVTVNTLRLAIREGRLPAVKLGRRILVCRSGIDEMLKRSSFEPCQGKQKAPGSAQDGTPSGSSSIEEQKLAQDVAKATLAELKQRCMPTSPKIPARGRK
jgi:hypothetical protein